MHVKYIVYYKEGQDIPVVDIWTTHGQLTHPLYVQRHNIKHKDISSEGYLNFNPKNNQWNLEHYQMDGGIPATSVRELWYQYQLEKRDKILVKRQIHQTPFLKNTLLREKVFKTTQEIKRSRWSIVKKLFSFQHD